MEQALPDTGQAANSTPREGKRTLAMPTPPKFATVEEERLHRKQKLAGALRLFGRFGFSEGVAGHITAGDPITVEARPDEHEVTVAVSFRAITTAPELLPLLVDLAAYPAGEREGIRRRLAR